MEGIPALGKSFFAIDDASIVTNQRRQNSVARQRSTASQALSSRAAPMIEHCPNPVIHRVGPSQIPLSVARCPLEKRSVVTSALHDLGGHRSLISQRAGDQRHAADTGTVSVGFADRRSIAPQQGRTVADPFCNRSAAQRKTDPTVQRETMATSRDALQQQ